MTYIQLLPNRRGSVHAVTQTIEDFRSIGGIICAACGNARRILARLQLWTMAQPLPPNNLNN
ncbi:hypothetical protein [Thalassolituus sp. UBA6592]|uniref:hypothetical protein n=1 Tax=Thalassolituus sp. UBA6592 TaxID=1947665 RepID=UPI0025F13F62|nr:hypothetical protein [Thalassolituus sp. UBA6592]